MGSAINAEDWFVFGAMIKKCFRHPVTNNLQSGGSETKGR
jgi:hypothetical protein